MSMPAAHKASHFRALHAGPGALLMPNAWDAGSARMLAGLGYQSIATSSGAAAGVLGRRDGRLTRAEALAHCKGIVAAVDVPVSADLENGFGPSPEDAALTVRMAIDAGLAGGSIEDATGDAGQPLYERAHAVQRVAAAVAAARSGPAPFVLTARAENFLRGNPDLDDTIARLQAFEMAGADVLFAPGLPDLDAVRQVCAALSKPFSFMVGIRGKSFSVAQLEAAGVRRISLATSLYRVAMAALHEAAREVKEQGTFGYLERTVTTPDLSKYMQG